MHPLEDSAHLEIKLRHTLQPQAVPHGMRDRVMARMHAETAQSVAGRSPSRSFLGGLLRRRMPRMLALGTCAAAILIVLVLPRWQERRQAELMAMRSAERDLAEVLQLAGSKWNLAQQAAFSPEQDSRND